MTKRVSRFSRSIAAMTGTLLVAVAYSSFAQPAGPAAKPPLTAGAPPNAPAAKGATTPPSKVDAGATPLTATPPTPATVDAGASTAPVEPSTAPTARKVAPPLTPPSPAQVAALEALQKETDAYEIGAREYRDTVTTIIKLHYETKKKEILSGLDHEIGIEKAELKKARDNAIARLEEFILKYQGANSQPEATPDAMYRLAALYEERARSDEATDEVAIGLKPAIALYKRVINEFPKYRELAGIYYFLGHAYNDSGRTEESQQVWRSLVCVNHFKYPTPPDPKNPDADTIIPLPQDHDEAYWTAWRNNHRDPKSVRNGGPDARYVDPYPQSCQSIAQPALRPGDEPKYVAEVWWQIGNWEFDQQDMRGGVVGDEASAVYDYNRAASGYNHSLLFKRPPLYGVALYKYSWTLFKQQRYEAATREFVHLLLYTDEQQKLTGDPGADFRGEAYTYIAGSLTNIDFKGPEADEPFIQRPDIVDTEPRPEVAEQKLHVALDRVRDPNLIPQDKPWTIEIYKALASEYRSLNQFTNAIETFDLILKKWPMDPTAPDVQNAIAETYDQMNVTKRPGTPEHDAIAGKALQARTALANYIGNTPWVDANKENPAAIQNAERLVKGGLRQAAAQHTNNGKQALVQASEMGDPRQQLELLVRANAEYRLAAIGWAGFLHQDENSPDAYESRYWLADARHKQLRISVLLHKLKKDQFPEPTQRDIDEAKKAAIDVRDSNEDDKYLDNAAFFVVEESDVNRDLEYQRFDDTRGTSGTELRSEVKFDSDGPDKKVVVLPMPVVITQSILARDEYVARVPPALDITHRAMDYQFYAADEFFVYGHFDEARQRFEPMYKEHCGKDEFGYRAWEKLISMSNMSRDAERSRQLAEAEKAHSCAVSATQTEAGKLIINPTLQEASFVDARKKFAEAKAAPPGPAKDKLWREAAGMYEAALQAAPARDEAPEAAMNAAFAYKQVGEFQKAIDLYNKFIAEYGSEARLTTLQKGDAKAKTAPDPKRYAERLGFLDTAYSELGTTYYGFFNYQKAAETYDKVATNERFDEAKRKPAAKNAMILYANMAQRDKMTSAYRTVLKLHPSADEKSNADFLVANYDYQQWNSAGGDTGANRQTRLAAQSSLAGFYATNRATNASAKYALIAAHESAQMMKSVGDGNYHVWYKNTIAAWDNFKVHGTVTKDGKNEALVPPFSDYGAEAEFTLVDEDIRAQYEGPTIHTYTGTIPDVLGSFDAKTGAQTKPGKYQSNAKAAERFDERLQHIVATYPSLEWVPAAVARQGSLYDDLRTGLSFVVVGNGKGQFKLFTPAQETVLKQMESSGRDDLIDKADNLRSAGRDGFKLKRQRETDAADEIMVRRYVTAITLARAYNVRSAAVVHAIGRLAFYTDTIGDAKLRTYVTGTTDPTDPSHSRKLDYKDGQFVQGRPGITSVPPPSGAADPLPVAP